jgi:HD domain
MEPHPLVAWAEQQAGKLLVDTGRSWDHVRGVVQQAQRASQVLSEEDRPYLVAAAWLHDIGYAPSIATTGFHPLDGARHVRALGQERLAPAGRLPLVGSVGGRGPRPERRSGLIPTGGLAYGGRVDLLRYDY